MSQPEAQPLGVTVVIPAYNYAHFLPEAIDSVLAQTYPHVECLVVDDGSKDNTPEVAASYCDRIVYHRKENAGLSAARNTGIELASMPLVVFLDADDRLEPEMLATMVPRFEAGGDDLGLVACQHASMLADGTIREGIKSFEESTSNEISAFDLLIKNRFSPASALIRKSVFESCGGFDTTLTSTEDRDMWIRIAARYRVEHMRFCGLALRIHGESMSHNAARMQANMLRVIKKHRDAGLVPDLKLWDWCKVYAYNYFHIAWMYYDSAMPFTALSCLVKSVVCYPIFLHPRRLNDPVLFRARAARTFLLQGVRLLTGSGSAGAK